MNGLSIRAASEKLFAAGLSIGKTTRERSEGVPDGQVIRQHPAAGGLAPKDGLVDLVVAGTPE